MTKFLLDFHELKIKITFLLCNFTHSYFVFSVTFQREGEGSVWCFAEGRCVGWWETSINIHSFVCHYQEKEGDSTIV